MSERSTERRTPGEKALERILYEEAKQAIPGPIGLGSAIRKRVSAASKLEAIPGRRTSPRRMHRPRLRLGLVTALIVLVFGGAAYATGGIKDALDYVFGETVPTVEGMPVAKKQSRGGVTVSIDRVYADSHYVAIGYTVEGLQRLGRPASDVPAWLRLTEPKGAVGDREYALVDGLWSGWTKNTRVPVPPKNSQVGTAVFETSEMLEAGEDHRFRAEVYFDGPTGHNRKNGAHKVEHIDRSFYFDLRIPIRKAPIIRVNQTVVASGVPVTLTQVLNSPVKTSAYLCFDPPQRKYDWPLVRMRPFGEARPADVPVYHTEDYGAVQDGCATYMFDKTLYAEPGTHTLTVTELGASDPERARNSIEGPWRFRFEVPELQLRQERHFG